MCDKYYGNYDKNIKSIRGGGVITPANPPNRTSTTNTIKNTWNKNIKISPPLFETVYYSDKNLTNGYLNTNNFIEEKDSISDYYYPSQKFDKVINLKKEPKKLLYKEEKKLNNENPIKFPPPLINTKIIKSSNKNKPNNKIKNDYLDYIVNNTIYDGKYIYKLEDQTVKIPDNINYKISNIPYLYKKINSKQDNFNLENFENNNNNNFNEQTETTETNYNSILLVIFSILLIIYFTIYQK